MKESGDWGVMQRRYVRLGDKSLSYFANKRPSTPLSGKILLGNVAKISLEGSPKMFLLLPLRSGKKLRTFRFQAYDERTALDWFRALVQVWTANNTFGGLSMGGSGSGSMGGSGSGSGRALNLQPDIPVALPVAMPVNKTTFFRLPHNSPNPLPFPYSSPLPYPSGPTYPNAPPRGPPVSAPAPGQGENFSCSVCTYTNPASALACGMCGMMRQEVPPALPPAFYGCR